MTDRESEPSDFSMEAEPSRIEASGRAVGQTLGAVAHKAAEVAQQAREARHLAEKGLVETRRLWRDLGTAEGRSRRVGVLVIAGVCAGFVLGATLGLVGSRR